MDRLNSLKNQYWNVIRATRKSGKISENIIKKEEKYWSQFPEDIIEAALEVHIQKYYSFKESYTRGIMRNMLKQKEAGVGIKKTENPTTVSKNKFNNFQAHPYSQEDLAALERDLLGL